MKAMSYPKASLSIVALVGALALFLILSSTLFASQPVGRYFYGLKTIDTVAVFNNYSNRNHVNIVVDGGNGIFVVPQSQDKNIGTTSDLKQVEVRDFKGEQQHSATINNQENYLVDSGCDLSEGKWIYDSTGPLYRNDSFPVLTQMQNCQGNGRPDKDYENWRWKPSHCELPRFDAKMFLGKMRGKTLAFIGDSISRNQMESLLCILWQVEVPQKRGNKKMKRYYFASTSTTIIRIWSSWLVHRTQEPFDFAPSGLIKLHLDKPDEGFMEFIADFDVIVLSFGHWFNKQSVYILNNEIMGGQLWWLPDRQQKKKKKIDNIEAFGISVETILTSIVTHPKYTGLTIVRSFSPDHYERGDWNTGGSCTGEVRNSNLCRH